MNRLFVALALPDHVRAALSRLRRGFPGARWVAEENFHLTLRFIGAVDNRAMDDIAAQLDRVREPGFDLELDGFGCFETKGRARALWTRVVASDELLHLQRKIDTALDAVGVERETRRFKPHVTLARFKDAPLGPVNDFICEASPFSTGPFPVGSFTLYRSFLHRDGPIYRPEVVYPLDGDAFSDPYFDEFRDEEDYEITDGAALSSH
ncbi:RNA 2',3'-cyclic phosphodiesterase [Nisaea denitrificans]|uniref:RNA 2',3'-cyclic phosphodiesterase n=1 Tax=Nisaea denitrificans TaxID=390877 RepID=UPI0004257CD4|nr:RNA 2',3'-cyclic phosphodiesterase [Nisaea denitrificans]